MLNRLLLAVLLLVAVAPARAQVADPPAEVLRPGAWALAFGLPTGGGGDLGYWRVQSPTQRIGLFVSLHGAYSNMEITDLVENRSGSTVGVEILLGPAVRRYLRADGAVLPFAQADLAVGYTYDQRVRSGFLEDDRHGFLGRVGAGIGLEWFPVRQVSVSGYTGMRLSARYTQDQTREPGRPVLVEQWRAGVDTFTSALVLTVFLPSRP